MATSDKRHAFEGLAWGLIIGGAIGVAAGLLVAPEQGHKVRRRLAYKLDSWADLIGDKVERLGSESPVKRNGIQTSTVQLEAEQIIEDANAIIEEMKRRGDN